MTTGAQVNRSEIAGPSGDALSRIGVVIIGRNEGLRLQRCFDTLPPGVRQVVYVDSGSTDDSVAQARRRDVEVVALDMSIPFTAARARNAGLQRLLELHPDTPFVQFIDGDCELLPGWLALGAATLDARPDVAVVCGRLREHHRDASIYHRLCDMEWDGPVGDVFACGGIAMMRIAPLRAVGGFTERLIAGEEPELCVRLRGQGHRVVRLAGDMGLHDAAMSRFGQWWTRAVRHGYCTQELVRMHPAAFRREVFQVVGWGLVWPALACVTAAFTGGLGLLLLALYPVRWVRILLHRRAQGVSTGDAALFATACIIGPWAGLQGGARFLWDGVRHRRATIIEYK